MKSTNYWPFICFYSIYRRANEILKAETFMFDKYMKRIEPRDLGPALPATQGFQPASTGTQDAPVGRGNNRYLVGLHVHVRVWMCMCMGARDVSTRAYFMIHLFKLCMVTSPGCM